MHLLYKLYTNTVYIIQTCTRTSRNKYAFKIDLHFNNKSTLFVPMFTSSPTPPTAPNPRQKSNNVTGFQIIHKNAENMKRNGNTGSKRIKYQNKEKSKWNRHVASITLSTGVIRLQLSYFRFKVIKRRVVFYDDHILGAK